MNWKRIVLVSFSVILLFVLVACGQNKEDANEDAKEVEIVTYENTVKGILSQNCLSCHGSDSPSLSDFQNDKDKYKALMKGPRFDNYTELKVLVNGEDAGAFMRRLDDGTNKDDGKPGNMYNMLGSTDEERQQKLAVLKEWTGSWNLKRSKDLTAEERAAITAVEK